MKAIELFQNYYQENKTKLAEKIRYYNNSLKDDDLILNKNLEFFKDLNSDGKLVRGILVKLGYELEKYNPGYSDNLALAYEVFQTSILIHDDIIDHDEKRRGKETIHFRNYQEYYNISKNKAESASISNSIALCMGDYGLFLANKIISDAYWQDPNLGKVLSYFNNIVLKTIKGEILDVVIPFQSENKLLTQESLEKYINEIYRLKTAYYTVVGPLSVGMILAGSPEEQIEEIAEFGEEVGIAFQIQDDILGIYSTEIGKVIGSDIKENKQTILYSYIQKTSYQKEFEKYYGKDEINDEVLQKVKELLEASGATQYAIDEMNKHYDRSIELLDRITWLEYDKKEILKGMVEYLRMRNK